jgi:hypothetical protein
MDLYWHYSIAQYCNWLYTGIPVSPSIATGFILEVQYRPVLQLALYWHSSIAQYCNWLYTGIPLSPSTATVFILAFQYRPVLQLALFWHSSTAHYCNWLYTSIPVTSSTATVFILAVQYRPVLQLALCWQSSIAQYCKWLYTSMPVTSSIKLTSTAATLMVDGLVTQVTGARSLEHFAPERVTLSVRFRLQSQTERIVRRTESYRTKHKTINIYKSVLKI